MQKYLLTLLIKDSLSEDDRKKLLDSFSKDFGKVIKEDLWGQRSLSYPIKHLDKAFYAHFEFEAEPASIPPLDKKLKLEEDVIRYLLIKTKVRKQTKASKKLNAGKVKKEEKPEETQAQEAIVA